MQTITTPCSVQLDREVSAINRAKSQTETSNVDEPEVATSADSDHEVGVSDDVIDDVASTQHQSAGDVEESNGQPDISMFPFVTVSPCRRKATPPRQRQLELGHVDDGQMYVQSSSPSLMSTSTVTAGSCGGWTSPTVSSTWMSPARVTSCTSGPDTPSPGSSCLESPKDSGRTPPISPALPAALPRGDVLHPADTMSSVVPGAGSPATSTPVAGNRVDIIKVPVYSPVYRDSAASHRRHSTRPASPGRCAVVSSHADVLDLSSSRKPLQHNRQGTNPRRAITFSDSHCDRKTVVSPTSDAASVPLPRPDEKTTKSLASPPCSVGGSLNRKLSVSTNSSPRRGCSEPRAATTSVLVCERQEADSASLSPSKPVQPTSSETTTTATTALSTTAAASTVQTPTGASIRTCSSRLVVNLQRCDSAPSSVALPGSGKRRRHAVGSPPSTNHGAPSKRRRLKLMCNGMTIYRDIDDVAAAAPARVRTSKCAATRRRASLPPTFPVESLSSSVVKRRHVSTDDVISASRDLETLPPPSVEGTSSENDVCLTAVASSDDSGIGPLDYSTDRASVVTVSTDSSTLASSFLDSLPTCDEPLELTTVQVRERQKNDCLPPQVANQFAVS